MIDGHDCYQNTIAEYIKGILIDELLIYKCNEGIEIKEEIDE